jgi:hypothetical protein
MSASGFRRAAAIAGGLIATTGTYSMTASPSASQPLEAATSARGAHSHVLLLSVDGMHQSDLRWYLAHHPRSAAARGRLHDKTRKIAEDGGNDAQDRHVPQVVSAPDLRQSVRRAPVETTQVAPTILTLLGLAPRALRAVRIEHTHTLTIG